MGRGRCAGCPMDGEKGEVRWAWSAWVRSEGHLRR